MPIYAYRCAACGHTKDVLRKMSDPPLADCPACGQPRFEKQVTAAGFQLKGSGWYVTDFRSPQGAPAAPKDEATKPDADKANGTGGGKSDAAAPAAASPAAPAAAAPAATAPASAPTVAKPAPATKPSGTGG